MTGAEKYNVQNAEMDVPERSCRNAKASSDLFGTGCDSIVGFPMHELESEQPKAVLGPLDPSVRVNFKPDISTFSVPWPKFMSMLENTDKSFLSTDSWGKIKARFSGDK